MESRIVITKCPTENLQEDDIQKMTFNDKNLARAIKSYVGMYQIQCEITNNVARTDVTTYFALYEKDLIKA